MGMMKKKEIKLVRNAYYASTSHQQNLTGVQNLALQEARKRNMKLMTKKNKKNPLAEKRNENLSDQTLLKSTIFNH